MSAAFALSQLLPVAANINLAKTDQNRASLELVHDAPMPVRSERFPRLVQFASRPSSFTLFHAWRP